jgi:hypothetical protein
MRTKSPLVALFVACLFLAGILPPAFIRLSAALEDPSFIQEWPAWVMGNPTVLPGGTEIDFRLTAITPQIFIGHYIYNTASKSQTLKDDDRLNSIIDVRYASIAVDIAGNLDNEVITVTPEDNLRCLSRMGQPDVWNQAFSVDNLGCPALFDLDSDGTHEVILGSRTHLGSGNYGSELRIINVEDGSVQSSTSLSGSTLSAPVIGDVDNDGRPEIVCSTEYTKKVYCLDENGTIEWSSSLPGSPEFASPIIGDFDADGQIEIVTVTTSGVVCYLSGIDGSMKKTVSTGRNVKASAVSGDIDGDGYLEIVIADEQQKILAIGWTGSIIKTWDANVADGSRRATPALADTDNDGLPEIICSDSHIRVFDWSDPTYARTIGWQNNGNSPVVFDSNNNGRLDIVYFMWDGSGNSRLYRVLTDTPSSGKGWLTLKNDFRRSGIYGSDIYGNDPDLVLDNHNWTYGNISKGSLAFKDFKLTNTGKVTLTGSCSDQGKITVNDTSSFSIPVGSSKSFRAIFDTSEKGIFTGNVIIETNDPDEPKMNLLCTANISEPAQDLAVYEIQIDDDLNPNYVPPVTVGFRNLGQWNELGVTTNLTIDGVLCDPLSADTFDMAPGEAVDVVFEWDRTVHPGEGQFQLVAKIQNANFTNESDVMNNVLSKTVNVHYPISVESATSWVRNDIADITYLDPSDRFTEGDFMNLKLVLKNEWGSPVTFYPAVNVVDSTGSPIQAYGFILWEVTLDGGEEREMWPGWWLGLPIDSDTKYDATVYIYDEVSAGALVLNDPYVHTFWVEPSS